MLRKQKGGCAICGRPPKKLRLAVDHNHAIEKTKVTVEKYGDLWHAWAKFDPTLHRTYGKVGAISKIGPNRTEIVATVKLAIKRESVRALLCMICNRKVLGVMERFRIRPDAVERYLKTYDSQNPLISKQESNVR